MCSLFDYFIDSDSLDYLWDLDDFFRNLLVDDVC